ncbi:hypothetical protein [Nocardioides bruguierae]|uniref:Fibronectin type III domain-containing protein n=1 Tax=Nocardioides bruguierae TaxID=2945102 RepID=A0A9X2DA33_9ACTN|nr:hypothetical protein [Nocardioides bruguierae]MCM0622083.1 hypothetical protein [Nocardioides bruguierae]
MSRLLRRLACAPLALWLVLVLPTGGAAEAAWADSAALTGTTVTAAGPAGPVLSCGALTLGGADVSWTAVPGATGYRLTYGGADHDVSAATLTQHFTSLLGTSTVTVRARFGTTWVSNSSNSRTVTVVAFLIGVCG